MKKFNYTMNHRADEAYMAKMCHEGWAAVRLVEGVWTFERCRPDQYVYRVGYLRGKSGAEVEEMKRELAARGISFVSRYSFWAIFRSERAFQLYTPQEELALCERIGRPMFVGGALSWLACFALLALAVKAGAWFGAAAVLLAAYAAICTCLAVSYTGLIRKLRKKEREK